MAMADKHQKNAVRIRARGSVQGVGFRYRCKWQAESLDLSGWVQNEPDGSVTIHLEGMGYRIDSFQGWLRGGVEGLHISRMECFPADVEGSGTFDIRVPQ